MISIGDYLNFVRADLYIKDWALRACEVAAP